MKNLLEERLERLFPVGRLDYDSEGLLLVTNDGQFALRVAHPRYRVPKTYRVKVRGSLPPKVMRVLASLWSAREDRYSELRSSMTAAGPKVEMSKIGG